MAKFLDTKHRLMPYLYDLAIQATRTGRPIQRAMFLEFPKDRTAQQLDSQYMFGPNLLIAPVFVTEGEESEYYIPEGTWTSFFYPDRTVTGPRWVSEVVPLADIPVFVRPNSALALGPSDIGKPDYDFSQNVELRLYEIAEGTLKIDLPGIKNGEIAGSIDVARTGNTVQVRIHGLASVDRVRTFSTARSVISVQGGTLESGQVRVTNGSKELILELA
jgi:alpha-glucosidase (family GH31 glycosyl hydrolase)